MSLQQKIPDRIVDEYVAILQTYGYEGFCNHIITCGLLRETSFLDIYYLDQSEAIFHLFRETQNENYLAVSKGLRRAAHKLHRQYLRINTDYPKNKRFLKLIRV